MPEATLDATADHGDDPGDTVAGTYEQARADLDAADEARDLATTRWCRQLEDEGVEKFEASWNDLLKSTEAELDSASPAGAAEPTLIAQRSNPLRDPADRGSRVSRGRRAWSSSASRAICHARS